MTFLEKMADAGKLLLEACETKVRQKGDDIRIEISIGGIKLLDKTVDILKDGIDPELTD